MPSPCVIRSVKVKTNKGDATILVMPANGGSTQLRTSCEPKTRSALHM